VYCFPPKSALCSMPLPNEERRSAKAYQGASTLRHRFSSWLGTLALITLARSGYPRNQPRQGPAANSDLQSGGCRAPLRPIRPTQSAAVAVQVPAVDDARHRLRAQSVSLSRRLSMSQSVPPEPSASFVRSSKDRSTTLSNERGFCQAKTGAVSKNLAAALPSRPVVSRSEHLPASPATP
jgi:hypothetical protein